MPLDHEGDEDLILSDIGLTDPVIPEIPQLQPQIDQALVCVFNCGEQNVLRCRKCTRPYCVLHANIFSPNFCKECFANLAVIESKFSRTFDEIDPKNQQLHVRTESCKRWNIDGPDWPFLNLWIDKLTDDELRIVWNFHFFVMKTIEMENEARKIERARELRNQPFSVKRSVIKTKTTRTSSVAKVMTADDIRAKLKKQGIPDATIEMMVKAMNVQS